jgi:hypothetical protein
VGGQGQDPDGGVLRDSPEPSRCFPTVHPGHRQIHQDEVGLPRGGLVERVLAVDRDVVGVAAGGQDPGGKTPVGRVVFHQQDVRFLSHCHSHHRL